MSQLKRLSLYLAPLVVFSFFPVLLSAQESMGGKTSSVTGCLKQGSENGGYYIMGDDGKMYELIGKGLSAHVNHKVTVTGTEVTLPAAQEAKHAAAEKTEAGSASYVDLKVGSVKMVSESCQ